MTVVFCNSYVRHATRQWTNNGVCRDNEAGLSLLPYKNIYLYLCIFSYYFLVHTYIIVSFLYIIEAERSFNPAPGTKRYDL